MDPMSSDAGQDESPVLGPPVEPPADVWANALAGALHDPRSPDELADLLPVDDDRDAGADLHGLDDADVIDGSDDLDDAADGVGPDPDDPTGPDPFGADGPTAAPEEWQPAPADPEDGPGWLE